MEDSNTTKNIEQYDLLIVVDATYSMSQYLTSLQTSLPQIISISSLTAAFSRLGLLGYRDYCDKKLIEWSGWLEQSHLSKEDQPDLIALAKHMEPLGGGDFPEATKTALAKAYEVMREDALTIILFYTDAPPHLILSKEAGSNWYPEHSALSKPNSYGGFGPMFCDWVSACRMFRDGSKKAQFYCLLAPNMDWQYVGHYNYFSAVTGGACLYLENSRPPTISKVTVELLLSWMGVEKAGVSEEIKNRPLQASLSYYKQLPNFENIADENDPTANPFFATKSSTGKKANLSISANITRKDLTANVMQQELPKRKTPVADFAKAWSKDSAYRAMAVEQIKKIIEDDVCAMALNPVFGSLWRAVCNDRTNEAREELITSFGLQVDRIANAQAKAEMKLWLEESYDYTAEVLQTINDVPESQRFPCVCLDPTISFVVPEKTGGDNDEDEEWKRPITAFRRDELLEIGRSCDYKILRRLGRVLTRLTYINTAADMPGHIARTTDEEVPKIPMALASKECGNRFWKILLHLVVPGTMLSSRPAALLAALSIRLGIDPLFQAAEREVIGWRNKWNDIDVPETWNVSCLSLLLDADKAYGKHQSLTSESNGRNTDKKPTSLLKDSDKQLFESLIGFKMLELNLDTILTAKVGWTPERTLIPMGHVVICDSCKFPRSVTIMGSDNKCGLCLVKDYESPEEKEKCTTNRVAKDHDENTRATWVECSMKTCRAQYIVYNVEKLNVRPKCHYCRLSGSLNAAERVTVSAPTVECIKCLNRMIWPEVYRTNTYIKSEFLCPACSFGHATIADVETTAKKISAENSTSWLVKDMQNPDQSPFNNRSLHYVASTFGTTDFITRIKLFPQTGTILTLNGKEIRNGSALLSFLQDLVSRRQVEKFPCSLCFSMFHPKNLNLACGRHGCEQRICRGCLAAWYGINQPGRVINTAALSCPFCRRLPSGRTLDKYGMGIRAVTNLSMALQEQGQWIYAWCLQCESAKQYMERVCARGMPPEVTNIVCEDCQEARRARERAIAEALQHGGYELPEEMNARLNTDAYLAQAKPCPGCGTMTQKMYGCDHITCTVMDCNTHWCYQCGKAFAHSKIYTHMNSAHGGLYGDEDDEDDGMDDED